MNSVHATHTPAYIKQAQNELKEAQRESNWRAAAAAAVAATAAAVVPNAISCRF